MIRPIFPSDSPVIAHPPSLFALIAVVVVCGGCEQRVEHADPERIEEFKRLAVGSTGSAGSALPATASPSGASPRAIGAKPAAVDDLFGVGFDDEAADLLYRIPENDLTLHLFAYAAWHLDQSGRREQAASLLDRARRIVDAKQSRFGRSIGTSLLIAATSGGLNGAYPELLVQSDKLFDELMQGRRTIELAEDNARAALVPFFESLVQAGRYVEAMRRLDSLKNPLIRSVVAEAVVRDLAARNRPSEVRRCLEFIRRTADGDERLRGPDSPRRLCSAYALADDLENAEAIYKNLPKATNVVTPSKPPEDSPAEFSAREFRPIVDVAAARRRRGDPAGCVQLIETELAELVGRDPSAVIAAWVECDELERALTMVRTEGDPLLKPRLAALLCRATVEHGNVEPARRFAAEFAALDYASSRDLERSAPARRFDARFAALELPTVIPLLVGDEISFRERIDATNATARCESLLRAASFLRHVARPRDRSFVPYHDVTVSERVFAYIYR